MAQEILYLKLHANVLAHQRSLTVKDVAEIQCSNEQLRNKVKTLKLTQIQLGKPGRYVKSVLDVIASIQEACPQLDIQNLGDADFIITLEQEQGEPRWAQWLKTAGVSLISFFGAAFSIMTFNNDVDVTGLFGQIYELFTGQTSDGFTVLELSYSVGLGLGIILFFNHFAGRKLSTDPTPLEVQMKTYENDVNQTIIASADCAVRQSEKRPGEQSKSQRQFREHRDIQK